MANRLADAVSPYLRSHADNPVDWREWGAEPFAEAAARDIPLLVSIGYSTCHWCHVMARESFSDPEVAAQLNEQFVAIKVDREEYPDVDSSYLAAAGAFTRQLGWPLNVFVTPEGKVFFAGTYWPPRTIQGHAAFPQVLDAVTDAWRNRRDEVDSISTRLAAALAAHGSEGGGELPSRETWVQVVSQLVQFEDTQFGGLGDAPKFPMTPVLLFLLERGAAGADDSADAAALAERTLAAMAASDLRDPIEGGFFRYSTMRDWTDPHYERMLYDNAMLLDAYSRVPSGVPVAEGIADFLGGVMRLPSGAFASAQDSESTVDGERVEGGYYRLDAAGRARQRPPALDEKVLTGWNGLAIGALARAGFRLNRPDWLALARDAANLLLARHIRPDGRLVRASIGDIISPARATLEDYGMFASGLLQLALATGEVEYAVAARRLVDATLADPSSGGDASGEDAPADGPPVDVSLAHAELAEAVPVDSRVADEAPTRAAALGKAAPGDVPPDEPASTEEARAETAPGEVFRVPGGGDPVLVAHGTALSVDPSEGAYPSGLSSMASAAHTLFLLTADDRYRSASASAISRFAALAVANPISFGSTLTVMTRLEATAGQLVVVSDEDDAAVASLARQWEPAGSVTAVVTAEQANAFAEAGFELFEGRTPQSGRATAYLCQDFVCRLPLTAPEELAPALSAAG